MPVIQTSNPQAPFNDRITDNQGLLSRIWQDFFKSVQDLLRYAGQEVIYQINNNEASPVSLGLRIDKQYVSFAVFEFCIQRVTSTTEVIETNQVHAVYRPDSEDWDLVYMGAADSPDNSGVGLSITADGEFEYTSSNIGGDAVLSRIFGRVRTYAGKSSLYSKIGLGR